MVIHGDLACGMDGDEFRMNGIDPVITKLWPVVEVLAPKESKNKTASSTLKLINDSR